MILRDIISKRKFGIQSLHVGKKSKERKFEYTWLSFSYYFVIRNVVQQMKAGLID